MTRTTKPICVTVLVLSICAVSSLESRPAQSDAVQAGPLDPRIGPAVPQRYKSVRDAKDWTNPYLVIRRDGIEVIAKSVTPPQKIVAATDLQQTLIKLPVAAWPYGRVVAVQTFGLREADRSDEKQIADNLEAARATLKALQVSVEMWPS